MENLIFSIRKINNSFNLPTKELMILRTNLINLIKKDIEKNKKIFIPWEIVLIIIKIYVDYCLEHNFFEELYEFRFLNVEIYKILNGFNNEKIGYMKHFNLDNDFYNRHEINIKLFKQVFGKIIGEQKIFICGLGLINKESKRINFYTYIKRYNNDLNSSDELNYIQNNFSYIMDDVLIKVKLHSNNYYFIFNDNYISKKFSVLTFLTKKKIHKSNLSKLYLINEENIVRTIEFTNNKYKDKIFIDYQIPNDKLIKYLGKYKNQITFSNMDYIYNELEKWFDKDIEKINKFSNCLIYNLNKGNIEFNEKIKFRYKKQDHIIEIDLHSGLIFCKVKTEKKKVFKFEFILTKDLNNKFSFGCIKTIKNLNISDYYNTIFETKIEEDKKIGYLIY
jgi:hypothetical protein